MDEICYGCLASLHEECVDPALIEQPTTRLEDSIVYFSCCCWRNAEEPRSNSETDIRTRAAKTNDAIRDQESTGRKRAVVAVQSAGRYVDGMVCEWANLRFAGGGAVPLVGCEGTILRAVKDTSSLPPGESRINVHHGPDKSTLNNEQENIHVICDTCHNRWHGLNNKFYAKERPAAGEPYLPEGKECFPHDPETLVSDSARRSNELYWALPPKVRPKVPYVIQEEEENNDSYT